MYLEIESWIKYESFFLYIIVHKNFYLKTSFLAAITVLGLLNQIQS